MEVVFGLALRVLRFCRGRQMLLQFGKGELSDIARWGARVANQRLAFQGCGFDLCLVDQGQGFGTRSNKL
jgi:hypothetical protein